jgi:hypothetical protein
MLPLDSTKILFWEEDMAILDTSAMTWELVEDEEGEGIRPQDGFTHVVGSTVFSFFPEERKFRQMDIGEWKWKSWEVS